ncbi:hypothetical protein L828_3201 [Mycobacteroides abscessus MAB_030201_1061]|nr:hypothetical protein [Mycobacteroides abscessus]ETZ70218.1 hypothetical protein L835_3132 [Mycobacteroides abscessus MAB_110811_1470]ETZ94918.1 hypothetical protein L828_3201 [Mycobacteroides abscessus MAB_030201_1061]
MSKCISGKHNYEHLGTSCDEMDEQLRVMREVALGNYTLMTENGPDRRWVQEGEDGVTTKIDVDDDAGAGIYGSGFVRRPQVRRTPKRRWWHRFMRRDQ